VEIETAIYNYLSTYSGLVPLIGNRVYPLIRPENDPSPAITYQLIYGFDDHSLGDDPGTTMSRFQFICWGTTYSSIVDVAKQVKEAFRDYSGVMGGTGGVIVQSVLQVSTVDGYQADTGTYFRKLDFIFNY
jgi:hypothetical protein